MKPVEKVLARLKGVRESNGSWKALCPVHDDREPSLSISESNDGKVLLKCFTGCETEKIVSELGLEMRDLFEHRNGYGGGGSYTSSETRSTDQPATLENYAAYVGLPVEFLETLSLEQYYRLGKPAVRIPYLDEAGEEILLVRSRVSFTGKPKILTRKGDKHHLYGLWKLQEAREAGYAWVVEGESDSHTAWYYGEPAIGIPGANGWKQEWSSYLHGIAKLYFVVEDEAGEACYRKLAATPDIQERLYRVELDGVKDISELHKNDPEHFRERLDRARRDARAGLDIAETEAQEEAREAWALCGELAEAPDILEEFSKDLIKAGVTGEKDNGKLLYLALTSRVLEKIVSAAVKGPSSGGKSYLVKSVVSFFPETAVYQFTSFSEKTLFYTEEPLSHRILILAEAAGGGDYQEYTIRTLLSEGRLEYEFVEKTAEGLRARRICKKGPTGFITTTTRQGLHAENETRYVSLTVTDTRAQTREIFRSLASSPEPPDMERWLALQRWIEAQDNRVDIPYAKRLAESMGDMAVRLRRDFSVVLSLIKTHAILHQATRERDSEGRIVATLQDYSRIREVVSGLIAEGVEATVPKIVRETVEVVSKLIQEGDEDWVTNRTVASELDIDKAAASRRVRAAVDRGYITNLEDRRGHPARLVVGDPMPEDEEILPPSKQLEDEEDRCTVDLISQGIQHPPSPSKDHPDSDTGGRGSHTPYENGSTGQQHRKAVRERFTI
ncbi:MAG: hypothetical protein ACFB50_00985 [Rubrobacteraceae bacterium]